MSPSRHVRAHLRANTRGSRHGIACGPRMPFEDYYSVVIHQASIRARALGSHLKSTIMTPYIGCASFSKAK